MIPKTIDTIQLQQDLRAQINMKIKDMTPQEVIEYFQRPRRSGRLQNWAKKLKPYHISENVKVAK